MSDAEHAYQWKRRESSLYCAELSTYITESEGGSSRSLISGASYSRCCSAVLRLSNFSPWTNIRCSRCRSPFSHSPTLSLTLQSARGSTGNWPPISRMSEATIEASGERDFTEDSLNAWNVRIREIESGGWPTYTLLLRMCQNEIARAKAKSADITHIPWWRSKLANFIRFQTTR